MDHPGRVRARGPQNTVDRDRAGPGAGRHPAADRHRPARPDGADAPATSCGTASRCVDEASVERHAQRGGLAAIAISHPHFYAGMATWSQAFDDCPIYIHAADGSGCSTPARVLLCGGETREILPGITVINTGGHFDGRGRAALGRGAGGQGPAAQRRLVDRGHGSSLFELHVQLPELDPVVGRGRAAHRRQRAPVQRSNASTAPGMGGTCNRPGNDAVERSAERYIRFLRASDS